MPVQPNVFKLEMTPPSVPTLNPGSKSLQFEMTLKNLATTKQRVIVSVESFFFELNWPRATQWPLSQVYHVKEPGETLTFDIKGGVSPCKDEVKNPQEQALSRMIKPEGKLRIYHRTTEQETDKDEDWGHQIYEDEYDYVEPKLRTVEIPMNSEEEWGLVEIDLNCGQETKEMKKGRKKLMKMKRKVEKKKLKKEKKGNKCSIS